MFTAALCSKAGVLLEHITERHGGALNSPAQPTELYCAAKLIWTQHTTEPHRGQRAAQDTPHSSQAKFP